MSEKKESGLCGFCGALATVKCAKCRRIFYCDRNCQKRHWKEHKKVCVVAEESQPEKKPTLKEPLEAVDVSNLELKVEVRTKPDGSLGVFTTEYVHKGDLLCFYDGETKDGNTKIRLRKCPQTSMLGIVDADQVFTKILNVEKCLAHPSQSGFVKIASDNRKSFGIGQWINDYTKPHLESMSANFSLATEELHKYQDLSLKKCNCQVNENFWFTANFNMESGTELFIHYGFQYWLKKLMKSEVSSPERRFFYYSLNDQSTQVFNLQKFYEFDDPTCISFLKTMIQMPESSIENCPNVKELLFELTMKNVDMDVK